MEERTFKTTEADTGVASCIYRYVGSVDHLPTPEENEEKYKEGNVVIYNGKIYALSGGSWEVIDYYYELLIKGIKHESAKKALMARFGMVALQLNKMTDPQDIIDYDNTENTFLHQTQNIKHYFDINDVEGAMQLFTIEKMGIDVKYPKGEFTFALAEIANAAFEAVDRGYDLNTMTKFYAAFMGVWSVVEMALQCAEVEKKNGDKD